MTKVRIDQLKVGDKIMPPQREVLLWMKRRLQAINQQETALQLTVTDIQEASPDKRGRWLLITGRHTPEWMVDYVDPDPAKHLFKFKARPDTPWLVV